MKKTIIDHVLNFFSGNFDNIVSSFSGVLLSIVSFWNGLLKIGLVSFEAFIIGVMGGIGGLLVKDIYKFIKSKLFK